jgi:hypothetical protein
MNKEEFFDFWNKNYPNTSPINYLFNLTSEDRWFRIHSLPESKRYANSDQEWKILLERQNTIINDFILQNTIIKVIINFIKIKNPLFKKYDFTNIGVLVDKEGERVFQSFLFETIWKTNSLNDVLKDIANDEIRGYIVVDDCIISPYDGGMNLYLKDTETRDFYKNKYRKWLSLREDGM